MIPDNLDMGESNSYMFEFFEQYAQHCQHETLQKRQKKRSLQQLQEWVETLMVKVHMYGDEQGKDMKRYVDAGTNWQTWAKSQHKEQM